MRSVRFHTADADAVPPRATGAQGGLGISTQDEAVAIRVGQVLSEGGSLIDVVPSEKSIL